MSITHADFAIERRFPWTAQQTFGAFSDPELKRQWFANPGNWPDAEWQLDFRVGGGELNSGGPPGGTHYTFKSRFHDIVENERIVFAYDLLRDHRLISVSLTTIEFLSAGEGTRLMFTEQGAFFDGLEDPAEREHGTGKLLDALERFLAGGPVR
jgi:uncharacterized protein YndB with AHSA1/START domain